MDSSCGKEAHIDWISAVLNVLHDEAPGAEIFLRICPEDEENNNYSVFYWDNDLPSDECGGEEWEVRPAKGEKNALRDAHGNLWVMTPEVNEYVFHALFG